MFDNIISSRSTISVVLSKAKSSILKLEALHLESTIELLAESQYHFIWRVDEIIKSSIEFSWDFELESDNVKTNFFYTVDLNGNKVLVVKNWPICF